MVAPRVLHFSAFIWVWCSLFIWVCMVIPFEYSVVFSFGYGTVFSLVHSPGAGGGFNLEWKFHDEYWLC